MGDTIGSKTVDYYLQKYKSYINGVVLQAYKNNKLLDIEEVKQELNIVIWRCYEKYKNRPEEEYIKILKISICNTMANIANKIRKNRKVTLFPHSFYDEPEADEYYTKIVNEKDARMMGSHVYDTIEELSKKFKNDKYVTQKVIDKMNKLTEDYII